MIHLEFPVTEHVKNELRKHGVRRGRNVKVRKDSYEKFLESIQAGGYSHLSDEQKHALAIGCCMTHPDHKDKHRRIPQYWYWIAAAIALLLLLGVSARAQGTSQIDVITFQDNSAVPIKTFAAPFRIQCGFNMTCTASGSVLTIAGPAASGTVTSFSAGTLPPLFTTSVANPTTTPALSFALSNAADKTFFGNHSGGAAAPSFIQPAFTDISGTATAAQEPATTVNSVVNDTNVTGAIAAQTLTLSWTGTLAKARNLATAVYTDQSNIYPSGTTQTMDTAKAAFWSDANIIDVARACSGTDMCDKFNACYALSAYTNNTRNILDGRGLATPGATLHCDNQDPFGNATRSTKWILPAAKISMLKYMLILGTTNENIAAPSAPSLATSTSGGSLAAAIGVGVKVAYCNNTGTSLPSSEATITTGAGATNSVTVSSPAFVFGATTYRAYSTTPVGSGWKENNASGCIPLGTNYVIKTIGTGAVPLATATAYGGMFELEGQGDSTEISLDQTTPGSTNELYAGSNTNTYIHNLKMTTGTSAANNGGTIQVQNGTAGSKVVIENVTIQGGGHGIYVGPAAVANVTTRNIRCSGFTVSASCIFTLAGINIRMDNTEVLNTVWPAGGNLQGVVNLDGCIDCSVNGVVARNLDFSNIVNSASVIVQNGSLRANIQNVNCQGNVNDDCIAVLTSSLDTNINTVQCANTTVGTGAGIGANANNGDCLDFFGAGRVTVSNVTAQSLGLVGGLRFPCFEFFDDDEINATNINCYDSSGEGVRIFGSPRTLITNSHFNRNGKSGVSVEDSASIVNCNNTTTVTLVSGNPFGPWNPGTKAFIGAGPTQFIISSVTNGSTLILTTTCNLGASQAFSVYSTDVQLNGIQADANGTGATGVNAQSGVVALGHSQVTVTGGSMNDDKVSQTQIWGLRTDGGTGARMRVNTVDFTGNLGGACAGKQYGTTVSGNEGFCDINGLSTVVYDDNAGEIIAISNVKRVAADVTNATTTFATITGLTFAAAASYKYTFDCNLIWQTNTLATGGLKLQVIGPAAPTNVLLTSEIWNDLIADSTAANLGISSATVTALTTAMNGKAAVRANATNYIAHLRGMLENGTTAGLVSVQFAEQGAGTATIKRDSTCTFTGVN